MSAKKRRKRKRIKQNAEDEFQLWHLGACQKVVQSVIELSLSGSWLLKEVESGRGSAAHIRPLDELCSAERSDTSSRVIL